MGAKKSQITLAFKEEAMRQIVVFDCCAESRNGMTSVKDAEYSFIHLFNFHKSYIQDMGKSHVHNTESYEVNT